jgi:hypothetical protein
MLPKLICPHALADHGVVHFFCNPGPAGPEALSGNR